MIALLILCSLLAYTLVGIVIAALMLAITPAFDDADNVVALWPFALVVVALVMVHDLVTEVVEVLADALGRRWPR